MIVGYSEMLKEIYGITPQSLESEISLLLKSKPSEQKIALLKMLAHKEKATASELLRESNLSNTGGSFRAFEKFLSELSRLKILNKIEIGRRTYYSFTDKSTLKLWLSN